MTYSLPFSWFSFDLPHCLLFKLGSFHPSGLSISKQKWSPLWNDLLNLLILADTHCSWICMNMPTRMNGSKHFLYMYMAFNSEIASLCHIHFLFVLSGYCGTPSSLSNGQRSYSSTTAGSRVTYSCNAGYRMTRGSSSRTCQSNGLWSGSYPTCSRKLIYPLLLSQCSLTLTKF